MYVLIFSHTRLAEVVCKRTYNTLTSHDHRCFLVTSLSPRTLNPKAVGDYWLDQKWIEESSTFNS